MPARPSGKHGSKQAPTIGMGSHWAENNRAWRAQHHCDTITKETSSTLYHSSFTSALFRTTLFRTCIMKTKKLHLHSRVHRAFSSPVTMELTNSAKSSAFFKAILLSVFFKTIFRFNHLPVLFRTTFFPYVSFLEKRPGFKFTRYHGTDDWSSSSQVIPLDRKVSLYKPGFEPSISRLA